MTKQTAELRRMIGRQRCLLVLVMAFGTEFFSFLFALYIMKPIMGLVMGEKGCGLFRGIQEKDQNGST